MQRRTSSRSTGSNGYGDSSSYYGGGGGNGAGGAYTRSNSNGYASSNGGYSGYGNNGAGGSGGSSGYSQQPAQPTYSGYGTSSSNFGVGSGAAYNDSYSSPKAAKRQSSFGSIGSKGKRRGSKSGGGMSLAFLKDKFVIATFVGGILLFTTIYYRAQYKSILTKFHSKSIMDAVNSYDRLEKEKTKYQKEAKGSELNYRNFKAQIRDLELAKNRLQKQLDEKGGISKVEADKLNSREEAWRKQVEVLQNATQRESKRNVVERFGPGPHHVEFTIQIPTEESEAKFQVELAPVDLLPHANHLFLEQVFHELWDGTWFYLNGPHVLQAGPQDWEEDSAGQSLKRFTDTQLDRLMFPEYSTDFPHVPWTMGFTGRPGGPDWYINKVDNTKPHGPGGQFQHDLHEYADSCFAKITEGKEVLQRIFVQPIHPRGSEYAYFLQEPVEIKTARIVEKLPEAIVKPKEKKPNKRPKNKKPQRKNVPNQELRDEERDAGENKATADDAGAPTP